MQQSHFQHNTVGQLRLLTKPSNNNGLNVKLTAVISFYFVSFLSRFSHPIGRHQFTAHSVCIYSYTILLHIIICDYA